MANLRRLSAAKTPRLVSRAQGSDVFWAAVTALTKCIAFVSKADLCVRFSAVSMSGKAPTVLAIHAVHWASQRSQQAVLRSMCRVLSPRHIFEIPRHVVEFVSIFVIDLQVCRARTDECRRYERVNFDLSHYGAIRQLDLLITPDYRRVQDAASLAIRAMHIAANKTRIRHAVNPLEAGHRFPFHLTHSRRTGYQIGAA